MNDNSDLESQVNQALDDSIDNLSPDIQRQLNRIRIEATQSKKLRRPIWQTAAAFSVMLALVTGWLVLPQSPTPTSALARSSSQMLDAVQTQVMRF